MTMLSIPGYSLVAQYFDKYYPLASGIIQASGALGVMVFAPLAQILLDAYGWRNTLLILGGIYSHLIVSGTLFRSPPKTKSYMKLNDVDCSDYCLNTYDDEFKWTELAAKNEGKIWNKCYKVMSMSGLQLFKNCSFIAICIALGLLNGTYTGLVIYLVPHCLTKGLSPTEASLLASIVGFALLLGCFGYVPVVSKQILSARGYIYVSCTVASISLVADTFSLTFTTILLSNICAAYSIGALHPLLDVCLKSAVDDDSLAKAFGWRVAVGGVFRIFSGFLIGKCFAIINL